MTISRITPPAPQQPTARGLELAQTIRGLLETQGDGATEVARIRRPALPISSPTHFPINLGASGINTTGYLISTPGYALIYKKDGSANGGRLDVECDGGKISDFAPGQVLRGYFDKLVLRRADRSSLSGLANLLVVTRPDFDLDELDGDAPGAHPFAPVDLWGDSRAGTFQAVTEDAQASGASDGFDVTGYKRIRVIVDTRTGGVNATSFTIIWYFRESNTGLWAENGVAGRVDVPDSLPTGERYRIFEQEIRCSGRMYPFVPSSLLLAAGRTGLSFIVQGIE